jgi:MoxR-like ATPase
MALLSGRDFAGPADVKAMAADVLRHRLLLTYEGLAEGLTPDAVIAAVLNAVPVP